MAGLQQSQRCTGLLLPQFEHGLAAQQIQLFPDAPQYTATFLDWSTISGEWLGLFSQELHNIRNYTIIVTPYLQWLKYQNILYTKL